MPDSVTENTRQLPLQHRAAAILPQSVNADARTADLVWSTGATVRRFDYRDWEYYEESLDMSPESVDLSRLNSGAPLLNTHNADDLSDVIGVVVDGTARVDGTQGIATVRFSDRADVEPIWRDVQNGIIRNVSVGYNVRKFEVTKSDSGISQRRAVDWQPAELSMVPVGADAGAGVRAQAPEYPCEFVFNRATAQTSESNMPAEPQENGGTATVVPPVVAPPGDAAPESRSAPKVVNTAKATDIIAAARAVKLPEAEITNLIARAETENLSMDQVRANLIDGMAAKSEQTEVRHHVQITRDAVDTARSAVEEALLHRYAPSVHQLTDLGRTYRGLTLLEMGRDLLGMQGINTRGFSKSEVAGMALGMNVRSGGMMSTSDFPAILANVANKTLRRAYDESPRTFMPFCRETTLPDFKPVNRTQLSGAPSLQALNEQGEYQRGSFSDGKETYALGTYGRTVSIDRKAIINDDLDAFTRIPFAFGQAAARMESDIVWALITGNQAMADGFNLFDGTNHKNVVASGASSAIGIAGLGAARTALRVQKGLAGENLNLVPAFILAPAALETVANQYTSSNFLATKQADISYASTLTPIIEPRLDAASATQWYMVAAPGQIDTIEYAYLDGQQGVFLETRVGWEVDGLEIKAREDFAAHAVDWRGFVSSPGA